MTLLPVLLLSLLSLQATDQSATDQPFGIVSCHFCFFSLSTIYISGFECNLIAILAE